uniref:NAD(P)(+)--arginine ADP-ribosyltransferase n=1 Tax=Pyrodinium bahamense TaxID=73915 RepID=A0A7S0FYL9_9DINO|mmetsp:Transcript_6683/g.18293  ORF Transcript_6683/g.18293 Transcript_6683/m.18293 type:complete len:514 (+) Transcript_6683:76-1617(+)
MPQLPLKTGAWAVQGKAVGMMFPKSGAGAGKNAPGLTFWVATTEASAGDNCVMWESSLKPAGNDKEGRPKFRINGHPEGGFFIKVDDDTLSECDKSMEQRCVWQYRDDLKGKFLTTLAAPPKSAAQFPTENFVKAVLFKDPSSNEPCSPPTHVIINACCGVEEELPKDSIERQKLIAKYYTQETPLYHEMNTALRNDDLSAMRYYSAYIRELREVFKTDHEDQIIEPFTGKVWRGINFPNVDEAVAEYSVGKVFVWSAFTSMSVDRDIAFNFGNVVFEVECLPPKEAYEGAIAVYAPASVQKFSDIPSESEILFPPNIQFKVKEVKKPGDEDYITSPLIVCETVAFDSDEGICEFQAFKKMLDDKLKSGETDGTPAEERAAYIGSGYKKLFEAVDTNSSKTLSKKEAKQALRKIQGAVSFAGTAFPGISMPGESPAALRQYVNEMFKAADMDGNGTLTFEELWAFIASKQGSAEAMSSVFAGMSAKEWTTVKATLDTIVEAFQNQDFSHIPGM